MIKVELADQDNYKVRVVSSGSFDRDCNRLQEILTYKPVYKTDKDGIDNFSHYNIPRIDLQEILKLFKPKEYLFDSAVKRDVKRFKRLLRGADPEKTHKGSIAIGKIVWRSHQEHWIRKDWSCRRIINDRSTGSGKTLMALGRTHLLGAHKTLIVTTNNIMMDWKKDINLLFGKDARVLKYKGSVAQRAKLRRQVKDVDYVIAGYGLAHELNGLMYDAFIFDEQDLLSNPETQRCKKLQPLFDSTWSDSNNQVIVQTATMTGNTPSTAYMAFWLIHPVLSGSFACFQARHEKLLKFEYKKIPFKRKDGSVQYGYKRVEKKIKFINKEELVGTFKNYTSDAEVVYPFKHKKSVRMLDMDEEQEEVYNELRDELESYIGRRHIKIKDVRTKMIRLMQASEGLFNFDIDCLDSSKLDYIVRFLNRTDHKVIVWSRFRPITDILGKMFADRGVVYNGGLSDAGKTINRIAFNGASNKSQRKEYEKLVETKQMGDLRLFLRDAAGTGKTENDYKPSFKIFQPGEAQFLFSIIHMNTSRGVNFQAADYALYSTMSFSHRAMVQTEGRHARIDSKHKTIYSRYLLNYGTGELKMKEFIEQGLADMKLTSDGQEKMSIGEAKKIAKILLRGDD